MEAVECLLQHGADPRIYADDSNTPEQVRFDSSKFSSAAVSAAAKDFEDNRLLMLLYITREWKFYDVGEDRKQ